MQLHQISILFSLQVLAFTSSNPIDISNQCEFTDKTILSNCYWRGSWSVGVDELVFREDDNFQDYGAKIKEDYSSCQKANLPVIDFAKYGLLSKLTQGGCCSDSYDRRVYRDSSAKIIIYEILVEYEGACEMLCGNFNWVLVPRIPEDYTIEFVVKEKNYNTGIGYH